ncbi:MAG: MFS transporter [Oscillospiraceae bacterium]|nr:MFS transporter [Oscillospiraceae bacterium]
MANIENNENNTENPQSSKSIRRTLIPFFLANGFIYGLSSLYYSFIPKYLKDIGGKSEGEIGAILSIGPLIGIVSLIFFGVISDKAKYKNNVLVVILIVTAAVFYIIQLSSSFIYFMIIFSVLMFFQSPFGGLIDAVSLEYTTVSSIRYGPIRVMGSLCFGLLSLGLSLILTFFKKYVDVRIIFPVFIVIAVGAVIAVKMMPAVKGHAHGKKKVSYREFFRDKTCIALMIMLFIGQFSYGCYNNFMQNFLGSQGNPDWVWGLTVFFAIVGEVIFFIKFDYFFGRFRLKSIVLFCVATQVLRYLSFAFLPYGASILVTSLSTGAFCTVINYAASYYINLTVKPEMRALGQTLLYSISFYIPRFLSGWLGGIVVQTSGFQTLMIICAVINILILVSSKFMVFKEPVPKQ